MAGMMWCNCLHAVLPPACTALKKSDRQSVGVDADSLLADVRARFQTELADMAHAIDHDGIYPRAALAKLGQAGLFSAHLLAHTLLDRRDMGASIRAMAAVGMQCMSTAFCA